MKERIGLQKTKAVENNKAITLPKRFVPEFWEEQDGRCALTRLIRERYEDLKQDAGVDSVQKDLLCRRAVFLSVKLETMEIEAAKTGAIEIGVYTQGLNCLIGLLKSLGLERRAKKIGLTEYITKKKDRTA